MHICIFSGTSCAERKWPLLCAIIWAQSLCGEGTGLSELHYTSLTSHLYVPGFFQGGVSTVVLRLPKNHPVSENILCRLLLSGSQASKNTSKASKAKARGGEKGEIHMFLADSPCRLDTFTFCVISVVGIFGANSPGRKSVPPNPNRTHLCKIPFQNHIKKSSFWSLERGRARGCQSCTALH